MGNILKFLSSFILYLFSAYADGELRMGTASGYAPYVSLNAEGTYEGFDIDVSYALARKLDKQLVLKDFGSMPSLLLALKQGKVDAIIWGLSIIKERQKEINLIHYQGEREPYISFLFWNELPEGLHSIEDLEKLPDKKPIDIEAATSQESILRNYPNLPLKFVDKISDAVLDVKYQKSIAVAIDPALIPTMISKEPRLKPIHLVVPSDLQVMGLGIGVAKENALLTAQVEKAISELKKDGTIRQLELKWKLVK